MDDGAEPVPGCGCDLRRMIWATPDLRVAAFAARNRLCQCGSPYSEDHRPRVFEVVLVDPERDVNDYANDTVMALSGKVIAEVAEETWPD